MASQIPMVLDVCVPMTGSTSSANLQGLVPGRDPSGRSLPHRRTDSGGSPGPTLSAIPATRRWCSTTLGFAAKLRGGRLAVEPDKAIELARYVEGAAPHLFGCNRLPRAVRRGRMRVVGTGVVEKHQDLVVGRRMKRRGMRWTRRGADNLLALQARCFSDRWPDRWGGGGRGLRLSSRRRPPASVGHRITDRFRSARRDLGQPVC